MVIGIRPPQASAGFKVFIRGADETVFLDEGGFVVGPGTETFIKVKLQEVSLIKNTISRE